MDLQPIGMRVMLRTDNANSAPPKRSQRVIMLLVALFGAGLVANVCFQQAQIGSFRTNDVLDAWTLLLCIYAAAISRCCIVRHRSDQSGYKAIAPFLSLSSVITLGLAVATAAILPSGSPECTVVMGCACQVIAYVAIISIVYGDGIIVGNKVISIAIALGLSLLGSGALVVRASTTNLGVVLPVLVVMALAARDIKAELRR